MARITQKDIARQLGLSASLVSRALAGTADDIGADPATVARIRERAAELGYVPSAAAQQLRGSGTPVLGLTVADMEDPFFGPAVAEVIRQSHAAGYALALTGFERRKPGMPDVEILLRQHLRGLIILGSGEAGWARPFLARRIPVVRIGTGPGPEGIVDVTVDEAAGFALLVDYLHKLGHRRFAFIGSKGEVGERRLRFVRRALRARGLALPRAQGILLDGPALEAGPAGADALEQACSGDWPSAIVCASDAVALGVLRGVAHHGVRVPEYVSVTGFDDIPLARLATPPLTSVRQPLGEMVRAALGLVAGTLSTTRPFPPSLVARGSTTSAWSSPR